MVHDLIRLFPASATEFESNGLGSLYEATSCTVNEAANGVFELEMEYPTWGKRYNDIVERALIVTKTHPYGSPQAFRIYAITRPIDFIIKVSAQHISYDLSGLPVTPFTANSCNTAFVELKNHSLVDHNFTFWTNVESTAELTFDVPTSTRAVLGDDEGMILDIYKGDYEFDNFNVKLYAQRGVDRGVTIRYGKNMTEFELEESISNVYSAVYPYWKGKNEDDEDIVVEIPERVVSVNIPYTFDNILVRDFSSDFDEEPSAEELKTYTKAWIQENGVGLPEASFEVSFVQLTNSVEYEDRALLEQIELFDTVSVEFPELNVTAKAKVTEVTYNCITETYDTITLGDIKSSISDSVVYNAKAIEKSEQRTVNHMDQAVRNATNWITNGKGFIVAVKDEAGNWKEICSLDEPNIKTAKKVWRWNNGGFGFSANGYNGPYTLAITQDGHIVADFVDTGNLVANIITTGILQDSSGNVFYLDLDSGILKLNATELTISGSTVDSIAEEIAYAKSKENIDNFVDNVYDPAIASLQKQIDGQIETWYYNYDPTLENEPASNWKTDLDKTKHEGDLFFNKTSAHAFRFMKDGTTWKWQLIQDTDITRALQEAANAQDTADQKRRVFIDTPYPPYDPGDIWTEGPEGDIYRCVRGKSTGQAYSFSDWTLASKYTDDSALRTFLTGDYATTIEDLKKQADKKAETWYQSTDPSGSWTTPTLKTEHKGDLWYNTTEQKTYIYNGTTWEEATTPVPQDVFDKIDGKAQVFIETPTTPYFVGDLWFDSKTSDIMTCIYTRKTGSYYSGDWEKRNKYVDNAAVSAGVTEASSRAKTYTDQMISNAKTDFDKQLNASIENVLKQETIFNSLTDGGKSQGIFMRDGNFYFSGSYIYGGVLVAGGNNNVNGTIIARNETGKDLVTLDRRGITLASDCKIAWSNISGTSNVAMKTEIPKKASEIQNDLGWITSASVPTNEAIIGLIKENKGTIITKDYIGTLKVVAGGLWSGTILAGTSIRVGGNSNNDGTITVTRADGTILVTLDNKGITLDKDCKISWLNISGTDNVASKGDIPTKGSQLSNDLGWVTSAAIPSDQAIINLINNNKGTIITKEWIGTLKVVAGSVNAGTVTSSTISGCTITGGRLESNDHSGYKIIIDSSKLDLYCGTPIIFEISSGYDFLEYIVEDPDYTVADMLETDRPVLYAKDYMYLSTVWKKVLLGLEGRVLKIGGELEVFDTATFKGTTKFYYSVANTMQTISYGMRDATISVSSTPSITDTGSGFTDENGECTIFIDDILYETTNTSVEYYVFLQKEGPGDIWVENKTVTYFTVRGTANLKFSWKIELRTRGYETQRLDPSESFDDIQEADQEALLEQAYADEEKERDLESIVLKEMKQQLDFEMEVLTS